MPRSHVIAWLALAIPRTALAYGTGPSTGSDCHEQLTRHAVIEARASLGLPPIAEWIEGAAPFHHPFEGEASDGLDVVAIALANREVDAEEMFDANQRAHCLRRTKDDDPSGSAGALAECRAYIMEQVELAFAGLGAEGLPDPSRRLPIATVGIWLPQFHVALGRALHALQDSFAHTYRMADGSKVTAVLNYVERDRIDPAIDGPAHSTHLDECSDLDEMRARRFARAADASRELVMIAFDGTLGREARERAMIELLDRYLSFEEGCTMENGWCDAPEAKLSDAGGSGCTASGERARGSALWIALLFLSSCRARRRSAETGSDRPAPRSRASSTED